jgi:tetratricopeptide (TPR) repeat protein
VRWIDQLRTQLPVADVIDIVATRMRTAIGEERDMLAWQLTSLLRSAGRYTEALQILDETIERDPKDVVALMSKASLYLNSLENPGEALKCIDLALERAYRTGFFRRQALGDKARILLQLGRGEALSQVLEEIMSLKIMKDIPDVGRERDFVDRAPPGLIREDVLARYIQFRPKREGDTTADEPPEYEFPVDGE